MSLRLTEEEYDNLIRKRKNERKIREQADDSILNELSARNGNSLKRGLAFEELIKLQCEQYRKYGVAIIQKTPEPFLVLKREKTGLFSGRFTRTKAQPDFQGTLKNGRSVILEAKSTSKDRIMLSALTKAQEELLTEHEYYGALCGILCEIGDRHFAIPYYKWKNAKQLFGHKYFTTEELKRIGLQTENGIFPFLEKLMI